MCETVHLALGFGCVVMFMAYHSDLLIYGYLGEIIGDPDIEEPLEKLGSVWKNYL